MGCDIHLWQEIKVEGVWHAIGNPAIDRSYALFEKMAGVRGRECNAIVPPRGLPDGLSVPVALNAASMGDDGHSHSWLTSKEVALIECWYEDYLLEVGRKQRFGKFGYCMDSGWNIKEIRQLIPQIQDLRWVFWFDN